MIRRVYCSELREFLEVPDEVGSIASLTPSVTEVLIEMGLKELITALSPWCKLLGTYGYSVPNAPVLGSYDWINKELINELRPDIVLLAGGYQLKLIKELRDLGISYYVTRLPRGLEMLELPIEVGYALGRIDEGVELASRMVRELGRASEKVKSLGAEGIRISLFMEIGELVVPGIASHATQALSAAGLSIVNRFVEASYVWGGEALRVRDELINSSDVIAVQVGSVKASVERAFKVLGVERVSKPVIALPILYLSDYGPSFIRRIPELALMAVKALRSGSSIEWVKS